MALLIPRVILFINLIRLSSSSHCSNFYPTSSKASSCECEDSMVQNRPHISLKCSSASTLPQLYPSAFYREIEIDSCPERFRFTDGIFHEFNINMLRFRHCSLNDIDRQTFSTIRNLEKFSLENVTIRFRTTNEDRPIHFQDLFSSNSFKDIHSLTLKHVDYSWQDVNENKLNLEFLLEQLPKLYRLELMNIHLDNYRHRNERPVGEHLTYLSLANTHQTNLLPLEQLTSLERLLIRRLPNVFHDNRIMKSLENLNKLKYILFEHNQLKNIDGIRSKSIDDVDLSSNLIEHLDAFVFENLPKLRQLTLTANPLSSIDRDAFCGVENLQRLSIHQKYRSISPLNNCLLVDFPTLQIIQDGSTKFRCNCQLIDVLNSKRKSTGDVNRLFKLNDLCVSSENEKTIHFYQLEEQLNCSNHSDTCSTHRCQPRTTKSSQTDFSSTINGSNSIFSSSIFLFLLTHFLL